ncbi:MAG: ferrochelatase [Vicinamibacterales bacterium]|nr:ferrochelatase [Vicinamibacterales bacterium]
MPFDAVLLISFGGPQGPDDIRPFLANVLRGRRIPSERIEEVAHHYELFGGVSPITELTMKQAAGLRSRLETSAHGLPVYVGMRNWTPFLADTLARMSRDGIRHAIGFILAAQKSYSSCGQYKQNVHDARLALRDAGLADVDITYVPNWHAHDRFIEANAQHVREAMATLPADVAPRARLVFTAHSIPVPSAEACQYREQLQESARLVAERLGHADWVLVYQSRSGRPDDPWLGPDICDYLREARAGGLEAAVLCPIGFVCDHVEVLYDLDYEAAAVCREVGLEMRRAETVNDDPRFLDMMDDVVEQMMDRYATGRPLQIVSATGFERREGPPPHARPPR